MERISLYHPFPEADALKEVIPQEGLALHGTSLANAENISRNGFILKNKRLLNHTNFLHFFLLSRITPIENSYDSYYGFKETLQWALLRGKVHGQDKDDAALVLFSPNLSTSEMVISDEPMDRFRKGQPIWIKTKVTKGHRILGITSFSIQKNGLMDVNQTVRNITETLKKTDTRPLEHQLPAQE